MKKVNGANLLDLAAERAALSQTSLAASGLAEDGRAGAAENDGGGVREHGGDLKAARALHIHEEGVRALYEALELVELGLILGRGVQ
jgi:hypothetical protein